MNIDEINPNRLANIIDKLTAPFTEEDIFFAPKQISKDRTSARAYPYVKAESIIKRFNDACGIFGWSNSTKVNPDGSVTVEIIVHPFGGGFSCSHAGVGCANDDGDNIDARKIAESDAFKRAARAFNCGLELWGNDWDAIWVPYDGRKITISREEMIKLSKKGHTESTAAAGLRNRFKR